jgi:hypothetical protein
MYIFKMTTRFPEFVFAEIASFLGKGPEGDLLRKYCGECTVRDDIKGATYRNGLLHSYQDRPAEIRYNRFEVWYKNGKLHREGDLPAYVDLKHPDSYMTWYKNGKIHRDGDLPALIDGDKKIWYKNGVMHRDGDKPAHTEGKTQKWCVKGLLHREGDLPATIEYELIPYAHPPYTRMTVSWFKGGKLHRDGDRPAVIRGKDEHVLPFLDNSMYNITGSWEKDYFERWDIPFGKYIDINQEWYVDGIRHRDGDKPAIRNGHGHMVWYKNGEKRRDDPDKPVCISGNQGYWIVDGKEVGGGNRSSMVDPRWF